MSACPRNGLARGHEARERVRPEQFEKRPHRIQPIGIDGIQAPVTLSAVDDEAGILQHAQVLGDRRPADGKATRDFDHWPGSLAKPMQDQSPGVITQGVEHSLGGSKSR